MRTARESAHRKIERRELHVDHHVVPRRCLTAVGSKRRRRERRLARANHTRDQSLECITAHQQVNGAIGAIFGIAHYRLLDQLDSFAHGGKGCFGGGQRARRLPAVGDLSVRSDFWFQNFEHALFKTIPLGKEQLAQIVGARRIGIGTNIFGEAFSGAMYLEPVKEWIAAQPVARLRSGDPLAPCGTIGWIWIVHLAVVGGRDCGNASDRWRGGAIASKVVHSPYDRTRLCFVLLARSKEIIATPPSRKSAPSASPPSRASFSRPTPSAAATSGCKKSAPAASRGGAAA